MKQINFFKLLALVSFLGTFNVAEAQVHPLSFGIHTLAGGTSTSSTNYYKDYVGSRLVVTNPSSIATEYVNKQATVGTGTSQWPDIIYTPIYNTPIVMDTTADSFGATAFPAGYFAGKIAVIWRGPLTGSGPVSFSLKAKNAQDAGAIAIVIINEYPGDGPFTPGYTTGVGTITIPVIMIGNVDGITISGVYHTSPPGTVRMSITPWGQGNQHDLGFVPYGQAMWHSYALPYNQFAAGNTHHAYKGLNGAFIANYGSSPATNVKVSGTLSFTPTGGSPTVQHSDTVTYAGPFTGVVASPADTLTDSIFAMFSPNDYTMTASGPGRFDLTYNISSDSVEQYAGDNTSKVSFYLTDSLYSKGRYDFVKNAPIRNIYEGFSGGAEITWGPLYYIAKGGTSVSRIQYSIANNSTAEPNFLSGSNDVLIFKWVDGSNDSILQNGELELVSMTTKVFDNVLDTSEALLTISQFHDSSNFNNMTVMLDSGSWYLFAIDLTGSSASSPLFLGCDGNISAYPRVYGRWNNNPADLEFNSIVETNKDNIEGNPTTNHTPIPFVQTSFVNVVDSFLFSNMLGVIPAVAVIVNNNPDTSTSHVGVNNTVKPFGTFNLFPIPASDHMTVSADLENTANSVTYRIMDNHARIIGKEVHNNVRNEQFTINTSLLAPGNYYLLINADGKTTSKKFTVIK